MALKKSKTNHILELLADEDKEFSIDEIAKIVGCSTSHVSNVRKSFNQKSTAAAAAAATVTSNGDENGGGEDEEVNEEEIDSFIKKVKITPDKDVLTENEQDGNKEEMEDYQCPSCGHTWEADKSERQDACPSCGEEFE